MTQFPSLPLFTDAFIADTGHLTAHQTGAYLMLLMVAWRMPGGRLPDDDAKLARWARVSPRAWPKTKRVVMEFWRLEDGQWTQKRLQVELERVGKIAATNRVNGRYSGYPKSLKTNEPGSPDGGPDRPQMAVPIPIPIKEKEKEREMDRVWVARDTPEWTAWQNVKKRGSIWSIERQQNGWWFESQWPPDHAPGPATDEPAPNPEEP